MNPTLCLNMIVKNEAHVIERCIASVRPHIHHWVIVDTGSTDGTQELIKRLLEGIPGDLHQRPWRNFGHNRTEGLQLARGTAEYLFNIDADEVLVAPLGFRFSPLGADAYSLVHHEGTNRYWRLGLFADRLSWRYEGVLHEYAVCDTPFTQLQLVGPHIAGYYDGGRSTIGTVEKYAADARVLEQALVTEPGNVRYVFYLAQSYRDSRQTGKAIETYRRRARMGGWAEEGWYSLYQVAVLSERDRADESVVITRYLDAFDYRPSRAEPLGQLARYCRERKRFASAQLFAGRGAQLARPDDTLFLDASFYEWRCLDEYGVSSYWVGDYAACAQATEALLASPALPAAERPRIIANLNFARAKLGVPEYREPAADTSVR